MEFSGRNLTQDEIHTLMPFQVLAINWGYSIDPFYEDHTKFEKDIEEYRPLQEYTDIIFRTLRKLPRQPTVYDIENKLNNSATINLQNFSSDETDEYSRVLKQFLSKNRILFTKLTQLDVNYPSIVLFVLVNSSKAFLAISDKKFNIANKYMIYCRDTIEEYENQSDNSSEEDSD